MQLTLQCPVCKNRYSVSHQDLASRKGLGCCLCGNEPAPDIMTAYQNVGKSITDLYGCCNCNEKKGWLPLDETD